MTDPDCTRSKSAGRGGSSTLPSRAANEPSGLSSIASLQRLSYDLQDTDRVLSDRCTSIDLQPDNLVDYHAPQTTR